MRFTEFLIEEKEEDKLKHLEHVEDHVIHSGHKGFGHAFHTLNDVHNNLQGKGGKDTQVTMKYDAVLLLYLGNTQKMVSSLFRQNQLLIKILR